MKAIITNTSTCDLPVVQWYGEEPGAGSGTLMAGESLTVDNPGVTAVDIGEVPSFRESLEDFMENASEVFKELISQLLAQPKMYEEVDMIGVRVENLGAEDIRALAGSNVDELWVKPNETMEIVAPGVTVGAGKYIELRQLGV